MESSPLVLTLLLTVFIIFFQHKAQAGNEDIIQLVSNQNKKIHQLAETVSKLQEKTTALELQVEMMKERQEEDANKCHEVMSTLQQQIGVLQEEVSFCQEQRTNTECEIRKHHEEVAPKLEEQNNKILALERDVMILNRNTVENSAIIKFLREPPESFACGYQNQWFATHATVTYDSIFYERSNQPTGGLDIGSGVFTAPYPGTYTVTWTLWASNENGDFVFLYLFRNGDIIDEPLHRTSLESISQPGYRMDQGGSTLIMHLDMGEEISLRYTNGNAHVNHVMFCVQLAQFDYPI